jgi:ATP-dependent helicase/DNAse subunit B
MAGLGLSLVVGPAHAGKVALLLERYVADLGRDPWLIVPNRADVDAVERDLLARCPALLAGRIGTFDDLFRELAAGHAGRRPEATDVQRALLVRRVVAAAELGALRESARSAGFADALLQALGELESALADPEDVSGDLAALAGAYRLELERIGLWDRDGLRRRAAERLESDLSAWHGEPVYAYGFEDLTGAEWAVLQALAGRTDVTVSLPYEPARPAFAALQRTAEDLASLAGGRIEELPPGSARSLPPAVAHVERALYEDDPPPGPPIDGAIRFFEGAGTRGTAELVADEVAGLLRAGTPAERIGVVCDSTERWRAALETTFGALELPWGLEGRVRLSQTAVGEALLALLRFAWLGGERHDLFAFLRSSFSGLQRPAVDFVEGRLRGRAVSAPDRVEEEAEKLRGGALPLVDDVRAAATAVAGARHAARALAALAHGLGGSAAGDAAVADLRALDATLRTLSELDVLEGLDGQPLRPEEVVAALERTTVRTVGAGELGRVAVLDLPRARTRSFEVVFVLGLEEGSVPRRGRGTPFLDDERRRALGGRLERPDPVDRDRYLFYTACTRASHRLVLVREAATDEGSPREPSPFWTEVTRLFAPDDVARWTRRRPLSALTWALEEAPSERERLRAVARLASTDGVEASSLATANGWSRRLERARNAFRRETRLRSPAVLEWLANRTTFAATELERFADCSSAWLVERVVDPKTIDAEPDAMLRGQIAHTALHRFYQAVPRELGVDLVGEETVEAAVTLMRRCVDDALASGVRLELSDVQAAELRQTLLRDLEGFVRDEAASELRLVPRKLEVLFGSDRAAPELQRGLPLGDGLALSGKIDRIDVDPFSASGIVQDYKSGKGAHSARDIDRELRLQIPLYLLVLRDLVGVEPLGGVYRALSGKRVTRGMLRASATDTLPGFSRHDYLDDEAFAAQIETARERAATYAQRIRAGDVRHDPKGDGCPAWCDLWPICRVERS